MAAAIDLPNAADTVLLEIGNDDPIPLTGEAGVTYRLVLENEAMSFAQIYAVPTKQSETISISIAR